MSILFVQSFDAGSFVPDEQEPESYTLTLEEAGAQTVFFSDRPARFVGTIPTERFVDGRAFDPGDPPNAAIVAQTDDGEDTLIVELTDPRYDAETRRLTYRAMVLQQVEGDWLPALLTSPDDDTIAPAFGPGSLFVDQLSCSGYNVPVQNGDCSVCCTGTCYNDTETGIELCT